MDRIGDNRAFNFPQLMQFVPQCLLAFGGNVSGAALARWSVASHSIIVAVVTE